MSKALGMFPHLLLSWTIFTTYRYPIGFSGDSGASSLSWPRCRAALFCGTYARVYFCVRPAKLEFLNCFTVTSRNP